MKNIGVYKIVNIENNKVYVGSSINLKSRKYQHFWNLEKANHPNIHMQRAYSKYGKDSFKWEIIEYVEFNEDKAILKNNLLEREQYWMDELGTYNKKLGYNICPNAGSSYGRDVLEETRFKLRDLGRRRVLSEETKNKIREANLGRKVSEETKKKLRDINIGNNYALGYKHTKEQIEKNRVNKIGRKVSEETKKKLRDINIGKTLSEEHKEKIRDSLKGHRHTEESKKKMRDSHRGKKFKNIVDKDEEDIVNG